MIPLTSHGNRWTYSTLILRPCLPTFEDPLFPPFWEHATFTHLFLVSFFFSFFNSLTHSVLYIVATPVLWHFPCILWSGGTHSLVDPQGSLVDASLCRFQWAWHCFSVAWRLGGWPGWALNPWLNLSWILWKYYFTVYVSFEKSTPTLTFPC